MALLFAGAVHRCAGGHDAGGGVCPGTEAACGKADTGFQGSRLGGELPLPRQQCVLIQLSSHLLS